MHSNSHATVRLVHLLLQVQAAQIRQEEQEAQEAQLEEADQEAADRLAAIGLTKRSNTSKA